MTTVETAVGTAKTMVLNMGPQHPSTHGVLRILLELDGETVVKAVPDLGYLHTGIEKSCEDKTYSQAITLTDRMDYLNPLGNNLVYCLAVEKLLGLEIPKRAQYIRVMMVELQRISSHLPRTRSCKFCQAVDRGRARGATHPPRALRRIQPALRPRHHFRPAHRRQRRVDPLLHAAGSEVAVVQFRS